MGETTTQVGNRNWWENSKKWDHQTKPRNIEPLQNPLEGCTTSPNITTKLNDVLKDWNPKFQSTCLRLTFWPYFMLGELFVNHTTYFYNISHSLQPLYKFYCKLTSWIHFVDYNKHPFQPCLAPTKCRLDKNLCLLVLYFVSTWLYRLRICFVIAVLQSFSNKRDRQNSCFVFCISCFEAWVMFHIEFW